ncbi:hypothetical protein AMECASPLE_024243 [Ameca splendens]|uniref:Uncharacterized protein n=1 Tax=Ameca splendens TaxID=208324 RepID=A0ABV0YSL7_9TELE
MNENTGYTDSISFYLTLHMIDDRMALDPVEFMSFASKRHQRAFLPYPVPLEGRVEEDDLWKGGGFIRAVASLGSPLLPPFPLRSCAGSQLNAIYFQSSRNVRTGV